MALTLREQDGKLQVKANRIEATIVPECGAVLESFVFDGVELAPSDTHRNSELAGTRLWEPEDVTMNDLWRWEIEERTEKRLVIHCWTSGPYFTVFHKRYVFSDSSDGVEVIQTLHRKEEAMAPEKYCLWTGNKVVASKGGWTFWTATETGSKLLPPEQHKTHWDKWEYSPAFAGAGYFNRDGVGLFFFPVTEHVDFFYNWTTDKTFGTCEWATREIEIKEGEDFETRFRILPVHLDKLLPVGAVDDLLICATQPVGPGSQLAILSGEDKTVNVIIDGQTCEEKLLRGTATFLKRQPKSGWQHLKITVDGHPIELTVGDESGIKAAVPVRRIGRTTNLEQRKEQWLSEPQIGPDSLLIANFNGNLNALSRQADVNTPGDARGHAQIVNSGKFGKGLRLSGRGDAIRYPIASGANWDGQQGTADLWIKADWTVPDKNWRVLFEMQGEKKQQGGRKREVNKICLMKSGRNQLVAGIYDGRGTLHRAYRQHYSLEKDRWVHVRMVWDCRKPIAYGRHVELFVNGSSEGNTYRGVDKPILVTPVTDQVIIGRNVSGIIDAVHLSAKVERPTLTLNRAIDYHAVHPTVRWTRPSSEKPIKALFIVDHKAARDVAYLYNAMSVKPTVVKFVYPNQASNVYHFYNGEKIVSHAAFLDRLRMALIEDYDVIVMSAVSFKQHLPNEIQEAIVGKVRKGTGLVAIDPHQFGGMPIAKILPLREVKGPKQHAPWKIIADHFITHDLSDVLLLPATADPYEPTSGETLVVGWGNRPLVQASVVKAGRVVAAGYSAVARERSNFKYFRTSAYLFPMNLENMDRYLGKWQVANTYYTLLLARCIQWAAGRDLTCRMNVNYSEADRAVVVDVQAASVPAGNTTVWLRFADMDDLCQKECEFPVKLQVGSNRFILRPPFALLDGRSKVDAILRSDAGILDFGAKMIKRPVDVEIDSLTLDRKNYVSQNSGNITMNLSGKPSRSLQGRLRVYDRFGRLGDERIFPVTKRETVISFRIGRLFPPFLKVQVDLLRPDGSCMAAKEAYGLIGRSMADIYRKYSFHSWKGTDEQLPAEACVLSSRGGSFGALETAYRTSVTLPFFPPSLHGKSKRKAKGREDRIPCFRDPAFLAEAKSQIEEMRKIWSGIDPPAFVLSDETRYSPDAYLYFEGCYCKHCLSAFRAWLQEQYGTLDMLNAKWGTNFTSWDVVEPMTVEEAKGRGNYAPWADFREFGDVTFAMALSQGRDRVRSLVPSALTIGSGTPNSGVSNGFDWWRYVHSLDGLFCYAGSQQEALRSFVPYTQFKVLPYNAGYGRKGPELFYRMFCAMVHQFEGNQSWGASTFYYPEGSLSESGQDTQAVNEVARAGVWDYVRFAQRKTPVAVLYSMPSLRAAYILNDKTFDAAVDGWCSFLHDTFVGWKFIASQQLDGGVLKNEDFTALILPRSRSLSDASIAAIRKYLQRGGVLVAHRDSGVFDEHLAPRPGGLVGQVGANHKTDVRILNIPVQIFHCGKGKLIVHGLDLSHYNALTRNYSVGDIQTWQDKVGKLLSRVGIAPFAEAKIGGDKPFTGMSGNYRIGETQIVLALPAVNIPTGERVDMSLKIDGTVAYAYLPFQNQHVKGSDTLWLKARKGWPMMAVISPEPIRPISVKLRSGRLHVGDDLEVILQPTRKPFVPDAVTLKIVGPDGKERTAYRQAVQLTTENARTVRIPLALNEDVGEYRLCVKSLLKSDVQQIGFSVAKPRDVTR